MKIGYFILPFSMLAIAIANIVFSEHFLKLKHHDIVINQHHVNLGLLRKLGKVGEEDVLEKSSVGSSSSASATLLSNNSTAAYHFSKPQMPSFGHVVFIGDSLLRYSYLEWLHNQHFSSYYQTKQYDDYAPRELINEKLSGKAKSKVLTLKPTNQKFVVHVLSNTISSNFFF